MNAQPRHNPVVPVRLLILPLVAVALWPVQSADLRMPVRSEAELSWMRELAPGLKPACLADLRYDDRRLSQQVDACFDMLQPARYRGLWYSGLETSAFVPAPESRSGLAPGHDIWLTVAANAGVPPRSPGKIVEIDFTGRRTRKPGPHGHLGIDNYEILIDRVHALKVLER